MNVSPTAPLDPTWLEGSLTECGSCHQPIAVPRGEEATKCACCGASSVSPPPGPRDDSPSEGDLLLFDLRRVPAGLEDLGERPAAPRLPALRRAWEEIWCASTRWSAAGAAILRAASRPG